MFIGLEIVWGHCRHLIENFAEVDLNFLFNADTLLKDKYLTHRDILIAVNKTLSLRVLLRESWNNGLMNLEPNLFLNFAANWFNYFIRKRLVNIFLIVVNCSVWLVEMLDVPEHLQRVVQGHEEIIKLVRPFDV